MNLLNGWLILIIIMKPTTAISNVEAVAISVDGILKTCPHITSADTAKKSVNPAGNAFNSTFPRKWPLILDLLGSSASKNPGIPIVNILINDTCDGINGYEIINTVENIVSNNENKFFTRKRLAERCTLLTTLRPSRTISGILEKSESRSTICAAWAVASLPDAIATLQSV